MNQQFKLLQAARSKSFFLVILILALVTTWLITGAIFAAVSAQTQNRRGATAKTTTVQKSSPKSATKSVAKNAPSPKTTVKPLRSKELSGQNLIVIGFNIYVRENAAANAKSKGRLKFGTIVRALEQSEEQETIGGKQDFWHKIMMLNGKSGWVFGAFLKPFEQSSRENIYQRIAAEKFATSDRTFNENVELYEFLTKAQPQIKTPAIAAQIGLWRLLGLKNALSQIPFDKRESAPYKDFTDANSINIVDSEPGGQWLVRSERFWSLSKRYANMTLGERSAWAAAQNPFPGECEGYLNCRLFMLRETYGEYLARFPKGAHAAEALKNIGEDLALIVADIEKKEIYTAPTDVSDRADFYKKIAELRSIVSLTGFFEKEAVLRQLNKIGEGYR